MSRIGKKPIVVPNNVKLNLTDRDLTVEGPNGKLQYKLHPYIKLQMKDKTAVLTCESESKPARSVYGLTRSLIANMVKGVTEGYSKNLEIVGVGFRGQAQGNNLTLQLGFSHEVKIPVPEGIKVLTPKPNQIVVSGIDKMKVGEFAASVRRVFPPEPYKGKGIRYAGEYVRKKLGKVVTK